MIDYSIVAKNLRRIMDEKKVTQRWLAKKSGYHVNTINAYYLGNQLPRVDVLMDIAFSLDVDVREFFSEV